jgi:hypothetical protein
MAQGWKLVRVLCVLTLCSLPLRGQVQAPVQPVPVPGGDLLAPAGLFNQFFPGVGPIYDGRGESPASWNRISLLR